MDNPEIQAILGTRHRMKTNKTKNGQPRNTGNIRHKTQDKTNKTKNGQHKDKGNIETQATIHTKEKQDRTQEEYIQ